MGSHGRDGKAGADLRRGSGEESVDPSEEVSERSQVELFDVTFGSTEAKALVKSRGLTRAARSVMLEHPRGHEARDGERTY